MPPTAERWPGLLAIGEGLFDAPGWWPQRRADGDQHPPGVDGGSSAYGWRTRNNVRAHYADAGLTLLRSSPSDGEEIWCRCDAGPHGFLSIAAHAHADALAVEVRLRRHGRAGGSRDVLLPRRTPLAQLLSLDPGAQHDRSGPSGPVNVGWPVPVDPSRSERA